MRWACLHFPALALNLVEQGHPQTSAIVIETIRKQRRIVLFANGLARNAGVVPGMTLPTAQGLVHPLLSFPYDVAQEQQALQQLAHWAYQFTPHIKLQGSQALLLAVGPSIKLFAGEKELAKQMLEQLPPGFTPYSLAFADTAMAALLAAQAHEGCNEAVFFSSQDMVDYDIQWLEISASQKALLYGMGLNTLAAIIELPRDGLAKRFGPEFTAYLRRLLGEQQDPLPNWTLPCTFATEFSFIQEVTINSALLFPIRHLLSQLEHYLYARQRCVSELQFFLQLRNRQQLPWPIRLATPQYRQADLLPLIKLQLEQLKLPAPVLTLQLNAHNFVPITVQQADFFEHSGSQTLNRYQLVERLQARLGQPQVHGLNMVADHRPEYSWSSATPGQGQELQHPVEQRPFWLFSHPQKLRNKKGLPVYHQPLQLLKGPERITTGWWDQQPIDRDYFVARQGNGQELWVYRERTSQQWFLHGIFSA